jgi:hypothetical protein
MTDRGLIHCLDLPANGEMVRKFWTDGAFIDCSGICGSVYNDENYALN